MTALRKVLVLGASGDQGIPLLAKLLEEGFVDASEFLGAEIPEVDLAADSLFVGDRQFPDRGQEVRTRARKYHVIG